MPRQTRLGDMTIGIGSHGLPCCPHGIVGFRITGSQDVYVNNKRASRALIDFAVHTCPHCGVSMCITGSPDTFINNYQTHRLGDMVTEFCGAGITVTGSPDVFNND
jgi:hypothetical protein